VQGFCDFVAHLYYKGYEFGKDTAPYLNRHRILQGRVFDYPSSVVRPLAKLNGGKPYWKQIKPFNFLLTCHVKPLGHPPGVKPERFHLIAPYETDSRQWLKKSWIDQYSEKQFRIPEYWNSSLPSTGERPKVVATKEVKADIGKIGINKCARESGFDRKNFIRKLVRGLPVKRNSYDEFVRWLQSYKSEVIEHEQNNLKDPITKPPRPSK
jgi:hypothetical protein